MQQTDPSNPSAVLSSMAGHEVALTLSPAQWEQLRRCLTPERCLLPRDPLRESALKDLVACIRSAPIGAYGPSAAVRVMVSQLAADFVSYCFQRAQLRPPAADLTPLASSLWLADTRVELQQMHELGQVMAQQLYGAQVSTIGGRLAGAALGPSTEDPDSDMIVILTWTDCQRLTKLFTAERCAAPLSTDDPSSNNKRALNNARKYLRAVEALATHGQTGSSAMIQRLIIGRDTQSLLVELVQRGLLQVDFADPQVPQRMQRYVEPLYGPMYSAGYGMETLVALILPALAIFDSALGMRNAMLSVEGPDVAPSSFYTARTVDELEMMHDLGPRLEQQVLVRLDDWLATDAPNLADLAMGARRRAQLSQFRKAL